MILSVMGLWISSFFVDADPFFSSRGFLDAKSRAEKLGCAISFIPPRMFSVSRGTMQDKVYVSQSFDADLKIDQILILMNISSFLDRIEEAIYPLEAFQKSKEFLDILARARKLGCNIYIGPGNRFEIHSDDRAAGSSWETDLRTKEDRKFALERFNSFLDDMAREKR